MQKELVLQSPKRKISHSVQSAVTHSPSFRGYHNASFLLSPQVSLTVAPFLGAPRRSSVAKPPFSWVPSSPYLTLPSWELQGGDWSPFVPVRVGPDWGRPWGLTWSSGHSWGAGPSLQWVQPGLSVQRLRTPVRTRTWSTTSWCSSSLISGVLCSSLSEPPVQQLKGLVWSESRWGLQKCCRKQYSRNQAPRLESWRTQVDYASGPRGPEELTLQALRVTELLHMDRHD